MAFNTFWPSKRSGKLEMMEFVECKAEYELLAWRTEGFKACRAVFGRARELGILCGRCVRLLVRTFWFSRC